MTFRAVSKMTDGLMSFAMMEGLMVMINGRFWFGTKQLLKATRMNRKRQKQGI